jgi:hypothetical protein
VTDKVQEGQRGGQFEEGPKAPTVGQTRSVYACLQLADQGSELLTTDQLSVNLRTLTDGHQVWGREQTRT